MNVTEWLWKPRVSNCVSGQTGITVKDEGGKIGLVSSNIQIRVDRCVDLPIVQGIANSRGHGTSHGIVDQQIACFDCEVDWWDLRCSDRAANVDNRISVPSRDAANGQFVGLHINFPSNVAKG